MEAGDEGVKMINGVVGGKVRGSGIVDAGDNGGHFFLDYAMVGTDGFLVVLKRDSEKLVLQLERLRESREVGGRSGGGVNADGGSGGGSSGSVVSVRKGIHFHWGRKK